jgi:hypothetical protein
MQHLVFCCWLISALFHVTAVTGSQQIVLMNKTVSFAPEWKILGPFKLGTRGIEDLRLPQLTAG